MTESAYGKSRFASSRARPRSQGPKSPSSDTTVPRGVLGFGTLRSRPDTRQIVGYLTEAQLTALQRTAGNAAVLTLMRPRHAIEAPRRVTNSADDPSCQRDVYKSFKSAVGSEHTDPTMATAAKTAFKEKKRELEKEGRDPRAAITGALNTILNGVLPTDLTTFDPNTFPWQTKIDQLFDNLVGYANANWPYLAGAKGRAPIFLEGVGHCGNLATAFLQTIRVLATELNQPRLSCAIRGTAESLLTPVIGGQMTGSNRPMGNIASRIDALTDPVNPDYAGVNRAHFKGHGWAEVKFPGGGTRIYDVLMNTKGIPVDPSEPPGFEFPPAFDSARVALPAPPGFGLGKYMVATSLIAQLKTVDAAAEALKNKGVSTASDVEALKKKIKAKKGMLSRPSKDLKESCRAVQDLQALPPELVVLYNRLQRGSTTRAGLISAANTIPAKHLTAITG